MTGSGVCTEYHLAAAERVNPTRIGEWRSASKSSLRQPPASRWGEKREFVWDGERERRA